MRLLARRPHVTVHTDHHHDWKMTDAEVLPALHAAMGVATYIPAATP
jgi:hypothetical protein